MSLVSFMTEGRIVALALEREDAVKKLREVMRNQSCQCRDVRKSFAASIERNCIHGSDAPETAAVELAYFSARSTCSKTS
jgi:nucleoside-diphosphate kinase